ncbi:MAG: nucleotidyltransferase domain-containing protein [Acetobacteraceae bacterium]|nr:nucleotidyltransferase domain-containing protein [Acetobacteraceae bacterium]
MAATRVPSPSVFLSVRLPAAERDRLKAAAAARGASVQDLVGSLVQRFLAEEVRGPPDLSAVLAVLRSREHSLRARGIAALWVFGSVVRGQARTDSDVDLMMDFVPDARISLVGLASLRADLSDLLGAPADLVERVAMRSGARAAAEREAVRVW